MKYLTNIIVSAFLILSFLPSAIHSQKIDVYSVIGQDLDYAIQKYGEPVRLDKSNKYMQCLYYKSNTHQIGIVASEGEIFQAEACRKFNSVSSAKKVQDEILNKCLKKGFSADTLNATQFNLQKDNIKFMLNLYKNIGNNKFEVKVKATKCSG